MTDVARTMARKYGPDILGMTAVCAAVIVLYHGILSLWWTMDDAFHLHVLVEHPLAYVKPLLWRALQLKLFTPWLLASLEADLRIAGLVPRPFYVHQLAALVLLAIALYATLRLWVSAAGAAVATLLIVAGAPFCTIAQQLMLRHYAEGLIFAAAALTCYVIACRQQNAGAEILSAILYFFAALSKEIYVPLPVILPLLVSGSRLRRLRFHGVALAAYVLLRWESLGTLGGGYGWAIAPAELPRVIWNFAAMAARQLLGASVLGVLMAIIVLICFAALIRKSRVAVPAVLICLFVAVLPVLPVAKALETRYALGLWLMIAGIVIGAAATFENSGRRGVALALLTTALVLTIVNNRLVWRETFDQARRMSQEGRWFLEAGEKNLLRNPAIPPSAIGELVWLKNVKRKPAGAGWSYDDIYFCTHPYAGGIYEYDLKRHAVLDVTTPIRSQLDGRCASAAQPHPLSARFNYRDGVLRWELGPKSDGQYRLILGDGLQAFDVPRSDGFQLPGVEGLTVRVAHIEPDGRRVYSPPIALDFVHRPAVQWQQ